MVCAPKAVASESIAAQRGASRPTNRCATKPTAATRYSARLMPKKIRSIDAARAPRSLQISSQAGERDVAPDVFGEQPVDGDAVGLAQLLEQVGGDQPGENPLPFGAGQRLALQVAAQARE